MGIRTSLAVLKQRVLESPPVISAALTPFLVRGGLDAALGRDRQAVSAFSQVHRSARLPWMRRLVEPYVFAHRNVTFSSVSAPEGEDVSKHFGGRLTVLKEPCPGGERGVLYIMFSEMLRIVMATMDVRRLMADYTLVSEPSWSGYCDEDFLRFTQFDEDMFVLAPERLDFAFLTRLASNLIPVNLGSCDWVDPAVAERYLGRPKQYDIVMNANWGRWKRHHVLFRMLRASKRRYSVALVGLPWGGGSRRDVEELATHYGVREQVTIFESIPFSKVMEITCSARVSILLSLKEGSNRAIPESIFCDVPAVVLRNNVGGIHKNIVPETGLIVDEADLESAVETLRTGTLHPRTWGLEHISCYTSSARLNAILRENAIKRGRAWTRDIAQRANSPESRYVDRADAERLRPWNEDLQRYVKQG